MEKKQNLFTPRIILQLLGTVFLFPFIPLILSGNWGWWEAWVNVIIIIGGFVVSRLMVNRRHPDLIAERARFLQHEDAKPWDKALAPLVAIGYVLVLAAAGLDERSGLADTFSLPVRLGSLAVILASYALTTWALVENRFFSGMVRIQTERGHTVVSNGPYRWLRHPGYAGGLLTYLATPFLLDSLWAILPAVLLSTVLVVRTALEDRTLQAELPGYADYARRVRWRLLPGVW